MKNIFYLLLFILISHQIYAQCGNNHDHEDNFQLKSTCTNPSTDKHKIIRINFHFIKGDSSHKTNFTPTSDGAGDMTMTGYKYADTITTLMNQWASVNETMKVRNTAYNTRWGNGWDKNYSFVLDAVYFDSIPKAYYYTDNFASTIYGNLWASYNLMAKDTNSVINIVINWRHSSANSNGIAWLLRNTTIIGMRNDYMTKKNDNNLAWHYENIAGLTMHEFGHLFNISHTVALCNQGGCDDECNDTPVNGESVGNYNGISFDCVWDIRHESHCTNNLMDYMGGNALTPCQLERVHCTLQSEKKNMTVCQSVTNDLYLADIGYPKVAHFGKNITLGNSSNHANLVAKEKSTLYFSESVVINNFEIEDSNVEFEVKFSPTCNF